MPQSKLKKAIPILLILTPFLLVGLVLALLYAPYLWTDKPSVDFIYSGQNSWCQVYEYYIQDQKISKRDLNRDCSDPESPVLFYHNVTENRSREISFEEAQNLTLDSSNKSSDGFILERKSNSSGGILFSSYNSGFYLTKGQVSFEQNLFDNDFYSYRDRPFVGWVVE